MDNANLLRIEEKLDKLTEAVTRLVVIEERQLTQGQRLGALEVKTETLAQRLENTDRVLQKWINFGMGAWAVVGVLFALWKTVGAA